MTTNTLSGPGLEDSLADLRATAPAAIAFGALVETGLADRFAPIETPLGRAFVAWNGRGVSWVALASNAEAFVERFRDAIGRPIERADALPEHLSRAIRRRIEGDRRNRIPLDLRGHTPFEVMVWMKALEIPRGEVRPYGWIAAEIGRPKAVRAVGTALGHNPVPLIVPCHRVVRSDGTIGQYSLGGPANKRTILAAEGLDPDELEGLARAGVRYIGSDTTHVYCLPSCHNARRIQPSHRVPFGSIVSSEAAGYRACLECRPRRRGSPRPDPRASAGPAA